MDIIKNTHRTERFNSAIISSYLPGKNVGVLDIETLGLNGEYSPMILAGLMMVDDFGNATITQFFADDPTDESELIESLLCSIEKCDYLLTYNGKHFDIPFILKRSKIHRIFPKALPYNLDLYLFLRGHSQLKDILPNLKQKTVEDYMGIGRMRDDEISGAQSVELYYEYLNAPSLYAERNIKKQILLHNHDDILQLYKLMPILQKVDIHKGFFYNGFVVSGRNSWPSVEVKKIKISAGGLSFSGNCLWERPFAYANYCDSKHQYDCVFQEDMSFSFTVPTKKNRQSLYLDLTDYFSEEIVSASFDFLPECVNSYLIIMDEGVVNYGAVNKFIMSLIPSFMMDSQFPIYQGLY